MIEVTLDFDTGSRDTFQSKSETLTLCLSVYSSVFLKRHVRLHSASVSRSTAVLERIYISTELAAGILAAANKA